MNKETTKMTTRNHTHRDAPHLTPQDSRGAFLALVDFLNETTGLVSISTAPSCASFPFVERSTEVLPVLRRGVEREGGKRGVPAELRRVERVSGESFVTVVEVEWEERVVVVDASRWMVDTRGIDLRGDRRVVRPGLTVSIGLFSRDDSEERDDPDDEKAELGAFFLLFDGGVSRVIFSGESGTGTATNRGARGRAEIVGSLLVSTIESMAVPPSVTSPWSILIVGGFGSPLGESRQRLE